MITHLSYANKTLVNSQLNIRRTSSSLEQSLYQLHLQHGFVEFLVNTKDSQKHYRVYGNRVGLVNSYPLN